MADDTWRDKARPLIVAAIEEGRRRGLADRDLRRFVNEQKPWECRVTSWGQHVWSSEVSIQLGQRRPLCEHGERGRPEDAPGQGMLFS